MHYQLEQQPPDVTVVRIDGAVTAGRVRPLYDELLQLSSLPSVRSVQLDFSAVAAFDSPAAAAVCVALEQLRRAGKHPELTHLSERQRLTFELLPALPPREPAPSPLPWLERLGARAMGAWAGLGQLAELMVDTVVAAAKTLSGRERSRWAAVVEQSFELGVKAVGIVGLLTFLTGLIMAFQAAYQLQRFGAAIFMAEIVSLGMVREFAALMTGIILAGRSSSAIAAELGTMAVREEIDALRTIGIDPISFLVLPRVIAITLVQPALTLLAMVLGIGGGLLVAWFLGLPLWAVYFRMQEALTPYDLALGLFKSFLFAWIVAFTGCYMGLATRGGASSVGRNTTRAVVVAIFLIVVADSVVTTLWTTAGYGEL